MVQKLPEAEFVTLKILPPMAELDERCARRFDKMMAAGALDEVRRLKAMNLPASLPAMKALGVPELLDFLNGVRSLEEAVGLAKLHTRQYAKRQRTWFKTSWRRTLFWTRAIRGRKILFLMLKNDYSACTKANMVIKTR